jgi:hypothetical protein
MASFIGGVYTSGWTIDGESQSPDAGDHVDDLGNTPSKTTLGWLPPFVKGSTDKAGDANDPRGASPWFHDQPGSMSPGESFDVLPEDVPWWDRIPEGPLPPEAKDKTWWDKLTPGSTKSPSEFFGVTPGDFGSAFGYFGGVVPGTPIPMPTPKGAEKARELLPDFSVPGFPDLGALLPLLVITMIAKD